MKPTITHHDRAKNTWLAGFRFSVATVLCVLDCDVRMSKANVSQPDSPVVEDVPLLVGLARDLVAKVCYVGRTEIRAFVKRSWATPTHSLLNNVL